VPSAAQLRHSRGIHVRPASFFKSLTTDSKFIKLLKSSAAYADDTSKENNEENPHTVPTSCEVLDEA
jgi:hypothetical protein